MTAVAAHARGRDTHYGLDVDGMVEDYLRSCGLTTPARRMRRYERFTRPTLHGHRSRRSTGRNRPGRCHHIDDERRSGVRLPPGQVREGDHHTAAEPRSPWPRAPCGTPSTDNFGEHEECFIEEAQQARRGSTATRDRRQRKRSPMRHYNALAPEHATIRITLRDYLLTHFLRQKNCQRFHTSRGIKQ